VIDAVVHAAALFRFSGPRGPFFRTNVDGTAALLKAAESACAKTFVYISAAGIHMYNRGTLIRDSDESAPIHWFWQPTNPAFARSRFAHPLSGGLVIRLAERFPKQSDLDSSPSSTAETMLLQPATWTMW
jgi:hypothetical protein